MVKLSCGTGPYIESIPAASELKISEFKSILVKGTTKYYWYCFLHQLWYKTLCPRPDRRPGWFWCYLYNLTGRIGSRYYRKIQNAIEYMEYMEILNREQYIYRMLNELKW